MPTVINNDERPNTVTVPSWLTFPNVAIAALACVVLWFAFVKDDKPDAQPVNPFGPQPAPYAPAPYGPQPAPYAPVSPAGGIVALIDPRDYTAAATQFNAFGEMIARANEVDTYSELLLSVRNFAALSGLPNTRGEPLGAYIEQQTGLTNQQPGPITPERRQQIAGAFRGFAAQCFAAIPR